MHELGITEAIVAAAVEAGETRKVIRIVVEIGMLTAISPDAVRFCFELCSAGTSVEGAELEIREIPGKARCRACGTEMVVDIPYARCACGTSEMDWLAGEELKVKELEVA